MTEGTYRLRRLARSRLLDVGAVALIALNLHQWTVILPSRWSDFDFNHFYVGSRMLMEGQNPYTTSLQSMSKALGFRFSESLPIAGYPPSFLWLFRPFAAQPPQMAFALWVALEIGCLWVVLWLTRRLLSERLTWRGWLFVAAAAISSRTVTYHLLYSQLQLLLAAMVLLGYAAHSRGRHGWASVAVSLAGILKFYPFILLPWFIWSGTSSMRVRINRALGVIGLVVVIVVLTGPSLWRDFFQYSIPVGVGEEIGRNFHFSVSAFVTNLGYACHGFHPLPGEKQRWWFMGTMAGLMVIVAAYHACLTNRRDPEAQFCMLCTAMLIGTVTVQGHYFVLVIFPLAVMAVRITARPTFGHIVWVILLVLAFNCVDPPDSPFWARHVFLELLVGDLPLYGLFALAAFFWWEMRSGRSDEAGRQTQGIL